VCRGEWWGFSGKENAMGRCCRGYFGRITNIGTFGYFLSGIDVGKMEGSWDLWGKGVWERMHAEAPVGFFGNTVSATRPEGRGVLGGGVAVCGSGLLVWRKRSRGEPR